MKEKIKKLLENISTKLSRGPAIVGTINTLAKQYLLLKEQNPTATRVELYKLIISQRYALLPIDKIVQQVLENKIKEDLKFKYFVLYVLSAETELGSTNSKFISKVTKVVDKELQKYSDLP